MLAIEKNQWIPRDDQIECEGWTEIVDLAVAVIKQAVKDDIQDGIDPMTYLYDERIVGGLWWNIISASSRVDVDDLKKMIVREMLDVRKFDFIAV